MDQLIQFNDNKPFFQMVATFTVAIASAPAIFNSGNPMNYTRDHYISMEGFDAGNKHLLPLEVYEQAQAGYIQQRTFLLHVCMMLANLAYETVKGSNDFSPEFEFFRHVRNAASHQNRFAFNASEPRRPAAWRSVILDHEKKGDANPLQGQSCLRAVVPLHRPFAQDGVLAVATGISDG